MEKAIKQKVVIYAIFEKKLLVFKHKDFSYEEVGIQVPAGSIKEDENPRDAALRELIEETGYADFEIVAELGTAMYDITPYRNEIQERHFFLAKPTQALPDRWSSSEGDIKFECFWIPLAQAHVLQSGQGMMLWKAIDILE